MWRIKARTSLREGIGLERKSKGELLSVVAGLTPNLSHAVSQHHDNTPFR